jgi:hypothetical protein
MGIDSLMAVELKSKVEREIGIAIPLLQLVKGPSLSELARALIASMTGEAIPDQAAPSAESMTGPARPLLLSLLSLQGEDTASPRQPS